MKHLGDISKIHNPPVVDCIALPQWWWITCKMAQYLPKHATLGSLFDGIGGFPLVWETRHGKGTAVWASEIEEFPIAVTKARFPE